MITIKAVALDRYDCPKCGVKKMENCRNLDGAALSIPHKDRISKACGDPEVIRLTVLNMESAELPRGTYG